MEKLKKIDLTQGSIPAALARMAVPITITGFVQMAYNLTDMFWIGRAGADYVAAVGAAGNFLWLADSLMVVARMGGQVKIGQTVGAKDLSLARRFIRTTFQASTLFGILLTAILLIFPEALIGIFNFKSQETIQNAIWYLMIVGANLPLYFAGKIFTGVFSALGNTKIGLKATGIGLLANIVLDPLFIFGFKMGVIGAAIATVIAEIIVFLIFFRYALKEKDYFGNLKLFRRFHGSEFFMILKIGLPAGIQYGMFALISLLIGRMIAGYGEFAVAAQKIGAQVEAIAWMTADGFSIAMNAFVAQNFGAGNMERIHRGYRVALAIMTGFGVVSTLLLLIFPTVIMEAFLSEPHAVEIGASYLRIMGYSQIFMTVEIMTSGAFAGYGITLIPSVSLILLTWIRIPMAWFLMDVIGGTDGIWWSITISSILKGVLMYLLFLLPDRIKMKRLR